MMLTRLKATVPSSPTVRTPMSPVDAMVSAERGTRAAGVALTGMATSAEMPSGIEPSRLGSSTSTR